MDSQQPRLIIDCQPTPPLRRGLSQHMRASAQGARQANMTHCLNQRPISVCEDSEWLDVMVIECR
jgi:hypothetical protein